VPFALVWPGNKLIISTSTISSLSNVELVHLLAHSLAHLILQHRRECESFTPLLSPVVWTLFLVGLKLYVAQWAVLWVGLEVYERRLEKVFEAEANRMAQILSEKAGVGGLIAGEEARWGCGGKVRF